MNSARTTTICLAALLALAASCRTEPARSAGSAYVPPSGFVPDSATAIKIAVAIWEPIYGADHIAGEKPFTAVLNNGVWTVDGTLPEGSIGGTAHAEISQADGRILKVIHYQ